MAGPCSVESREQILLSAQLAAAAGAKFLRGGAYKPRSSPYSFQGMGLDGLKLLREVADATGLLVITEVMEISQIEPMVPYIDCFQVGARNMQNFNLLRELGHARTPILLKRGIAATIEEVLLSAEYILSGGNYDLMLCERGIRTYETYTRNTMDISAIPVLHKLTHLPVIGRPLPRRRHPRPRPAHGPRLRRRRRRRPPHGDAPQPRQSHVRRRPVPLPRPTHQTHRPAPPARARGRPHLGIT